MNVLLALLLAVPIPDIGPDGPVIRLHTGFRFTEGPAADAHGNVCFTDVPNERIWRVDRNGKLTLLRADSRRANGLMFTREGVLLACEGAGQVVALSPDGRTRLVVADTFGGERFNAPNDLVIDRAGGIYFTDPYFGRRDAPLPQGAMGVYYVAPDNEVTRLLSQQPHPNGIILSPDEKTLYVVRSRSEEVIACALERPGRLGGRRVFARLRQPEGRRNTGGDGLTVDANGNLYITTRIGIQVISPRGNALGVIEFPEVPSNCTFGGPDRRTLYVTARTSLYTVRMKARGHRFQAP